MKEYKIKSPSGKVIPVWADSFYQARNLAAHQECYTYLPYQYHVDKKKVKPL